MNNIVKSDFLIGVQMMKMKKEINENEITSKLRENNTICMIFYCSKVKTLWY